MNISTQYLGLTLRSPLVVSANPLSDKVENIQRMEAAGAGAVVLYSLFEEQLRREREAMDYYMATTAESHPEAVTYFPDPSEYRVGPEGYLEHIRKSKAAVSIPVIASLNGASIGGWTTFARDIEQAGADALELNIYNIPTNPNVTAAEVEQTYLNILTAVKSSVRIPVAVKLGPFFSNFANMAKRLSDAGADGLVLFNRFYQPDIDLESLEMVSNVLLSTPQALRLPLTWIGLLYGKVNVSFAATSGVHTAEDVLKLLMVGADVTMMASALLRNGIDYLSTVEKNLVAWMEAHEYESVAQMKGSMSQVNSPDPTAFERAQYMKAVSNYPSAIR
jgi:dihydroorotate dehydrogenase (fumarate)